MKCCGSYDLLNHVEFYSNIEACDLVNRNLRSYFLGDTLAIHLDIILYVMRSWRKDPQVDQFPPPGEVGQKLNILHRRSQ
jgi:hypothetical protein